MTDTAQTQTMISMGAVRGFTLYVVYDNATGKILKYGQARDTLEDGGASMAAQCDDASQGAIAVSGHPDPKLAYIPGGVLTARTIVPVHAAIAGRVVTLTGVPSGATWSIREAGMAGVADASGRMVITFAMAGTYTINVTCFPAQDFSQQVILT